MTHAQMHVLIVEDDLDLGAALVAGLRLEGIAAVWVRRLADAAAHLDTDAATGAGHTLDAVLLDLGLPDGDGLALLRSWRARHAQVPVLVISARSTLEDRLAGLDGGADDFLVKPFAVAELVSRLWAIHRRCARQASAQWVVGPLRIAPRAQQAWYGDAPLALSAREFRLLVELTREPGAVISKSLLGQRLEPLGESVDPATIEVHLSNLRRKLGAPHIRTLRGVGYQWVVL